MTFYVFVIENPDYSKTIKDTIEELLNMKQNLSVKHYQEQLKKNDIAVDTAEGNLQVTISHLYLINLCLNKVP